MDRLYTGILDELEVWNNLCNRYVDVEQLEDAIDRISGANLISFNVDIDADTSHNRCEIYSMIIYDKNTREIIKDTFEESIANGITVNNLAKELARIERNNYES